MSPHKQGGSPVHGFNVEVIGVKVRITPLERIFGGMNIVAVFTTACPEACVEILFYRFNGENRYFLGQYGIEAMAQVRAIQFVKVKMRHIIGSIHSCVRASAADYRKGGLTQ